MSDDPIVETPQGSVRGLWRDGSAAFLGIPFAEAPTGENRFAAPVPHPGWSGVRDGTSYGATPQRRQFAEVTAIPEPSIPGDETLTVNVFTPSPGDRDAKLPVMVWLHGGGFIAGSPASPWYDGRAFNRDGVVTVSVSYRLGFDGFGWLPDAPQNRGLLDQIAALAWVRDSIAAFGGDPDRVTIAGQSAGGGSVLALLISPLTEGLFQQAIIQSGALASTSAELAEQRSRLLSELGGVECSRDGFATLTEDQILDLTEQLGEGTATRPASLVEYLTDTVTNGGDIPLPFGPWVDGTVIPEAALDLVADGIGSSTPVLIGTVAHEFTMSGLGVAELAEDADVEAVLGAVLGTDLAAEYIEAYSDLTTLDGTSLGALGAVGQVATDAMFRALVPTFADARDGAETWVYDDQYRPGGTAMATHCADLPFVWDCLDADLVPASLGENPPQVLADAMHSAWVSFCRTGNPGWPAWSAGRQAMVFAEHSETVEDGYALERQLAALPRA